MQKSKLLTLVAQHRKHPVPHQRTVLGSSTVPDALAKFLGPDYSLAIVKPHVLVMNGLPQNSKWKCRVVKKRAIKHKYQISKPGSAMHYSTMKKQASKQQQQQNIPLCWLFRLLGTDYHKHNHLSMASLKISMWTGQQKHTEELKKIKRWLWSMKKVWLADGCCWDGLIDANRPCPDAGHPSEDGHRFRQRTPRYLSYLIQRKCTEHF